MKNSFSIILLFLILTAVSCSRSPQDKYNDILEQYAEGKISDTSVITGMILNGFAASTVDEENIFISKSAVITGSGSDVTVSFPENIALHADKSISDNISFADIGSKRIVLGNNKGFCVFDSDGDPVTVYRADRNANIDAAALRGDNIPFLAGGKMQELSASEKQIKIIDPGEYLPPYKKYFRSSIISSDKYFALITGIAGSYYISLFDASNGSSKVKNIAASSFEFNMKDDYLLYIRGGTGNWSIVKYDILQKRRNELKTLGRITDVYLAQDGFIYINEKRIHFENLKGEKAYAPADMNVKGTCRNSVLAEYKNQIYIIDFNVLFDRLKEFNSVNPAKSN